MKTSVMNAATRPILSADATLSVAVSAGFMLVFAAQMLSLFA